MAAHIPSPSHPAAESALEDPVWGVVLAAGASSRMGRDKALLPWFGRPIVVAHIEALRRHGLQVVVVVSRSSGPVVDAVRGARAQWLSTGGETDTPFQSLAHALRTLRTDRGVVVTPVDVPPPSVSVLTALEVGGDAVPVDQTGVEGHPIRLGPESCAAVRRAEEPDEGLRTWLRRAPRVQVDRPLGQDFDTPEAWALACRHQEGQRTEE